MADIRKNTVHTLDITGYTAEGMGVARLEGRVVFVPCTIQGERWRVRLEKVNKNVAWGRGTELLLPSPERITPDCPLYGRCGGCQFRHMTYAQELRAKGQRITDALARISYNNERIADIKAAGQISDEEADAAEAEAGCGEDAPCCCETQNGESCCCEDKDEPSCCCEDKDAPSCCCQDEDKPQE